MATEPSQPTAFHETQHDGSPPKKKRRNRIRRSCKPCTERHIRCDLMIPCFSCIQRNQQDKCLVDNPRISQKHNDIPTLSPKQRALSSTKATNLEPDNQLAYPKHNSHPHASSSASNSNSSSSNFVRFLNECNSSLQMNADASHSTILNGSMPNSNEYYPKDVQKCLEEIRSLLPPRAANTVHMLRRCVTLGVWVGCNPDCAEEVGLGNPLLPSLYELPTEGDSDGDTNDFSLGHDTSSAELFPSTSKRGDAAKLSLAIAMMLGAISLSSVRLAALCYELTIPYESLKEARQQLERQLETAITTSVRLSRLYDGQGLIPTIRASIMYIYYLTNKGRVEDESSKTFRDNLVEMIKISRLHRLGDVNLPSQLNSQQLESRRILFAEFLLDDRFTCAFFGHPTKLAEDEITTLLPTPSPETSRLLFTVAISKILLESFQTLQGGATSYEQIDAIDLELDTLWNQRRKEAGTLREAFYTRDRAKVSEAFMTQHGYCNCKVMLHRSCFFKAKVKFSNEDVWKSRRKCFEAVCLSVEAQETMRYSMEVDEVMSSFRVAWCPTENVITLLLASILALRETLADNTNARKSNDTYKTQSSSRECLEAIKLVEKAKKLATRSGKCLRSLPPGNLLAEKALLMLDRVESKADAVLSGEAVSYGATPAGQGDTAVKTSMEDSLSTDIPWYTPIDKNENKRPDLLRVATRQPLHHTSSSLSKDSLSSSNSTPHSDKMVSLASRSDQPTPTTSHKSPLAEPSHSNSNQHLEWNNQSDYIEASQKEWAFLESFHQQYQQPYPFFDYQHQDFTDKIKSMNKNNVAMEDQVDFWMANLD